MDIVDLIIILVYMQKAVILLNKFDNNVHMKCTKETYFLYNKFKNLKRLNSTRFMKHYIVYPEGYMKKILYIQIKKFKYVL